MSEELRISITDVRKAGLCPGFKTRRWFEDHGFPYRQFLKDGALAEDLLATGDGYAIHVVEHKIRREWLDGDPSQLTLTADDLKHDKQCMAGARAFAVQHGIDWQQFLDRGIPATKLLELDAHEGLRVLRMKMERGHG